MAKDARVHEAPADKRSKGEHGGNRGGRHDKDQERRAQSDPAAGKDPHRGNR